MPDRPTIPPAHWQSIKLVAHGNPARLRELVWAYQDGYQHALRKAHEAHLALMKPPQPPSEDEA